MTPYPGDALKFGALSFDLGTVDAGSIAIFDAILENQSDMPLPVRWLSDPGLRLYDWNDRTIKAKEKVSLRGEVDVPSQVGPWTGPKLAFGYDGKFARMVKAVAAGQVREAYEAIPPTLVLQSSAPSELSSRTIRIVANGTEDAVRIEHAESTPSSIVTELRPPDRLSVRWEPVKNQDHQNVPSGEIRVWISGRTRPVVIPVQLLLGHLKGAAL